MEGSLAVTGRLSTSHVVHGGDTPGARVDGPGPNYKGEHLHTRNWPVRNPVEGGGGADQHMLPVRQTEHQTQIYKVRFPR